MKLVYDISSIPKGLDIANFTKIFENHHVVFWDSANGGTKPRLYADDGLESKLTIVDMEGKELDIESYSKQFRDAEYWERELHNCKTSPMYFYTNYMTPVWPVEASGMRDYLLSLGLATDENAKQDSESAADAWEKQKEIAKKAAEAVTLEILQERKLVVSVLKAQHEEKVAKLEQKHKGTVALFDPEGKAFSEKARVASLCERISAVLPVHKDYTAAYRNKKGKWDQPMLYSTAYEVLIMMYDEVLANSNRA